MHSSASAIARSLNTTPSARHFATSYLLEADTNTDSNCQGIFKALLGTTEFELVISQREERSSQAV